MEIKVLSKQTFQDISIACTGTVDNAFEIAKVNKRSVTDILTAGEQLIIPITKKLTKTLQYYSAHGITPATGNGIPITDNYEFAYEFAIEF